MNTETVQVIQADHDAVVAYLNAVESESGVTVRKVSGNHPLLQAFARHRLASQSLSTDEEVRRLRAMLETLVGEEAVYLTGNEPDDQVEAIFPTVATIRAARSELQSKDTPSHGG